MLYQDVGTILTDIKLSSKDVPGLRDPTLTLKN